MRSEGTVVGFVCLCVCLLLYISPLGCLFVSQTMRRTQRAMKVINYERFFLKNAPLQSYNAFSIVRIMRSRPFFIAAENAHAVIMTSLPRPGRLLCVS